MAEIPGVSIQTAAAFRRRGDSDHALSRGVRAGELTRVRRGAYVDAAAWTDLPPDKQHMLRVFATNAAATGRPVFSHESAAAVWGIPIVGGWPSRAQTTVPPGSGLRSNRAVVRHEAPLDGGDITEILGVRITELARTVVDVIASRPFLSGACAAEHVLRQRTLTRSDVLSAVARRRPFRGARRVDAVLEFASELSASPNETLCRVRFDELGFPQPDQQREYRGMKNQAYSVDFYWPAYDVICETDGRAKYENPVFLAGRTPEQALWDEKEREDDLRAQCSGLVRLTWDDAWNRAGLISKLTRAGIPRRR